MGLLVALGILLPIAELYVIVQVAIRIGVLNTLGLLILVSMIGVWLVKREGLGLLRRLQNQLAEGQLPGRELVDGFLLLFAGALLAVPGFITDVAGLLLLLPPVRFMVRTMLSRRFEAQVISGVGGFGRRARDGLGGSSRSQYYVIDEVDEGREGD